MVEIINIWEDEDEFNAHSIKSKFWNMGQILKGVIGQEGVWAEEVLIQWLNKSTSEQFKWIKAKISKTDRDYHV